MPFGIGQIGVGLLPDGCGVADQRIVGIPLPIGVAEGLDIADGGKQKQDRDGERGEQTGEDLQEAAHQRTSLRKR